MHREIASAYTSAGQNRKGVVLFVGGALLMVAMVSLGYSIEQELTAVGMRALEERRDPVMGLVFLFAFGFPLGVVVSVAGALALGGSSLARVLAISFSGILLASLAALVPAVFGRETGGVYFGASGITILLSVVASFWFWGRYRAGLSPGAARAADLKALGYLCFALAAWNTCGLASLHSVLYRIKCTYQQGEKRPGARRASAGLAVANSSERNDADGRLSPCPSGAPQKGQCFVAVLGKGSPFPADCASPWPFCGALICTFNPIQDTGFGLFPETMLSQGMRPFAVGQAKAIMAYFVLGWVFTAAGMYKSLKT